jgi:hypothetical protein
LLALAEICPWPEFTIADSMSRRTVCSTTELLFESLKESHISDALPGVSGALLRPESLRREAAKYAAR